MGGIDRNCNDYDDEEGGREQEQQLIPGLPDEIGMECLVRVPYGSHSRMKSVCSGWRTLFSRPSFYEQRRKAHTAEHLVCLVQPLQFQFQFHAHLHVDVDVDVVLKERDDKKQHQQQQEEDCRYHHPSESESLLPLYQYGLSIFNATHQTWHQVMMPGMDSIPMMFSHCVALPSSGKLLLLGGWDPTTLHPVPHVYVLDFIAGESCHRWRRAAPMSVARSFFACAVVGRSTLYVAGGHDNQKNALRSAEVYDAEADKWQTLPAMSEERDESQGLSWEGDSRFWVVSGYSTENQGRFRSDAECYDPETGCWSKVEGLWPFPSSSPRGGCVTGQSNRHRHHHHHRWWRFAGEEQVGIGEIREYEREADRWRVVSSIPLPHPEFGLGGSSKCVINLDGDGDGDGDGKKKSGRRMLMVMGSGGEGEGKGKVGAFILERNPNEEGKTKWNHVHVPPQFNGFPYSAAHLLL